VEGGGLVISDTTERGFERLICTALTTSACAPEARPSGVRAHEIDDAPADLDGAPKEVQA